MLDDTSWFELGRHHGVVTAAVNERTIAEKLVRVAPETVGVPMVELSHLVGTVFSVFLLGVCTTPHQKLHLVIVFSQ